MTYLLRLLILLSLLIPIESFAREIGDAGYPIPNGMVTDISGLLPTGVHDQLETTLRSYRDATSIEIAVLIVPSLQGQTPNDYAQAIWKQWRIGKQGQDNGVLLLVAPPPERKAWIATGFGIQGWLTDVDCKHIIGTVMHPLNQQGKRAEAVIAGVNVIIAKLGNTPWAQRGEPPKPKPFEIDWPFTLFWIFLVVIALTIFIRWLMPRKDYGSYGAGGLARHRNYSSGNYSSRSRSASSGGYSGGGSSDSGSSWSSGSSDGGGGFGGGDSGGGGGGGGD